jgi:NADPH-dependent ferric siderophore reductase
MDDGWSLASQAGDAGSTLRRWRLTVEGVEQIAPRVRRLYFTAPDLADMNWTPGQDLLLNPPGGPRRRCTIRAFHDRTLSIDFVLDGAAMPWAGEACPGDRIEALARPGGSAPRPTAAPH